MSRRMVRKPDCIFYLECLDRYARLDVNGDPHTDHNQRLLKGWDCRGCPRYQAEEHMPDAEFIGLMRLLGAIFGVVEETEEIDESRRYPEVIRADREE